MKGDVFVSVKLAGSGSVEEFSPSGNLIQTLTDASGTRTTTGSTFDTANNFYMTDFDSQEVSKFDPNGKLLGTFGSGFSAVPESIVFDASGNAYVGQLKLGAIPPPILKFDSTGNLLASFSPAVEDGGTDWIDLAADQHTIFYTSRGHDILRFDTSTNTQLPNFNTTPLFGNAYALRILPDGGVLVADFSVVDRLDASGNLVQIYGPTGISVGQLFALNLDPDGTSFWTADAGTANVFHFDIASGKLLGSFNTGTGPNSVFGLSVFGGMTTALSADLAITMTASPNPTVANPLTYTLTVSNSGPDNATGVTVRDTLPGSVNFVSATSSQGSCSQSNGVVTCTLGNIANGGSATITLVVTPTQAGTITNVATVTGNEPDPTPGDNTATLMTTVQGGQVSQPVVTCVAINPIAGAPFSGVVATFTDADGGSSSAFSATLDWGDGTTTTGTIATNGNGFNVSGFHTYAFHGPETLIVTVNDTDGTSGKGTCPLTVTATGLFSTANQNATINFWAGTRGQALIDSFNGGPSSTALATWLATSFPNLYGASAGANNVTGMTNAQVAALFLTFYAEARPKPDAQALTLALDIYATTLSLGGTAGTAYGFSVTSTGLGASFVLVGANGAAFDVADNQGIVAYDLLRAANAHAVNGVLYSGNSALLQEFLNVVIDLNDTGMNG
jgi:uncharacterized repeat protein (TIGR01451 family)